MRVFRLLGPKLRSRWNRMQKGEGRFLRLLILPGATLGLWVLLFAVFHRVLVAFRGAEGLGELLAGKLLGLAFLTFLLILLLSNVITALSTFFLARDLELLRAAPVDPLHLYWARLLESLANSSWMVLLLLVPLLAAYGVMYSGGVGFLLLAPLVTLAFLLIPSVLGAAVTLLLVNVFPARRTRDLLALLGLAGAAAAVVLLRWLRPEQLVRPEAFRSLVDFLAVLRTPTSPWLPSEWAAAVLMGQLRGVGDPLSLGLLLSTAAALVVLGGVVHLRSYGSGYTRAQEGDSLRLEHTRRRRGQGRPVPRVLQRVPASLRALMIKEFRVFFRDATQWSQLGLLGVLVVVYLYNIRVLPVGADSGMSLALLNLVGFLNLGLAGFVMAAIAARFVFPAFSLEGRLLWLLRSAPLNPKVLYRTKFVLGSVPLLSLAIPLIVLTNLSLGVSPLLFWVSTLAMVGATLALTALALTLGALFPNLEAENSAEIPTSFGGLLFMILSVFYLSALVALSGWPVARILRAQLLASAEPPGWWPQVAGFGGAVLLTLGVLGVAFRVGEARVARGL